ncbi:hypothetical protein IJJ97_07775 [bacterium]|nr:hypothetical protein [bacterium]
MKILLKFLLKCFGLDFDSKSYESKSYDCKHSSVEFIDLDNTKLDADIVKSIPYNLAKRYNAIPIDIVGNTMKLAMAEPDNILSIDDIRLVTDYDIEPFQAEESAIQRAINRYFVCSITKNEINEINLDEIEEKSDLEPVVRVFNLIVSQGIKEKANEIQMISDDNPNNFTVYYVADGVQHEVMQPPSYIKAEIITHVKNIAGLSILKKDCFQEGRANFIYEGIKHEFIISIVLSLRNENVFMKILN